MWLPASRRANLWTKSFPKLSNATSKCFVGEENPTKEATWISLCFWDGICNEMKSKPTPFFVRLFHVFLNTWHWSGRNRLLCTFHQQCHWLRSLERANQNSGVWLGEQHETLPISFAQLDAIANSFFIHLCSQQRKNSVKRICQILASFQPRISLRSSKSFRLTLPKFALLL